MMSSEDASKSDDSVSAERNKRNPLSDTDIGSEQRLSPVPSCLSMKTDQSMEPPGKFSKTSSDEDSPDQRNDSASRRKKPNRKFRSRDRKSHCTHVQLCPCCCGNITPASLLRLRGPENPTAASGQDAAQPALHDCLQRGNRFSGSTWLYSILSLLFMVIFVPAVSMYFGRFIQKLEPEAELEMRLSLVGKTGVGKSAAGNTILGRRVFEEKFSVSPVTKQCQTESVVMAGKRLIITDMPAVGKLKAGDGVTKCNVSEMVTHAFLLVIKLGRVSEEELETVKDIKEVFGEQALGHTLVLFTGGDNLGEESVFELLDHCPILKELISSCGGRFHIFNNKDGNHRQVKVLLQKIETMLYMNSAYSVNTVRMNISEVSEDGRVTKDATMATKRNRAESAQSDSNKTNWDNNQKEEEGYGFLIAGYLIPVIASVIFLYQAFASRRSRAAQLSCYQKE